MASVMRFDQWQDSNGNPVASGVGGVFSAPGNIIQVVRATDSTDRTTSSAEPTYVDADLSVTITPVSATSTLFVVWTGLAQCARNATALQAVFFRITDSSNNPLSGAEAAIVSRKQAGTTSAEIGLNSTSVTGVVVSGSTSSRTYKARFCAATAGDSGSATLKNSQQTGALTVYEVAG
jgi:hypothetical protein